MATAGGGGGAALPSGVRVRVLSAQSFRWSDSDWIARVEVEITSRNGGVVVDPAAFGATSNGVGMTAWSPAATIQSPVTVGPGRPARGTLAWYYARTLPRPAQVTVSAGAPGAAPQFRAAVVAMNAPDMVPTPVATAPAQLVPLPAGVMVHVRAPAITYRWPDGDWIVRAEVLVSNGSNAMVTLDPNDFGADAGGQGMTRWSPAATLQSPFSIAPGQSTGGALAWYTHGSNPQPTSVTVRTGTSQQTVPVVPGTAPGP
jgi:hypothetical protein